MNSIDLTKGPIGKQLFSLAAPLVVAISANMAFNLIDTYFVGRLGIEQLTAISFSFPIVIVILNLAIGIGIGISSVLSRLIGQKEFELVQTLGFQCTFITVVNALLIALVGVFTIDGLFSLLGARPEHLPYIHDYMKYTYFAMAFRMISLAISGSFRSHGKTVVPSIAILVSVLINTVLDPLLIFGLGPFPQMGIAGAGLATLISNFLALCFEIYIAIWRYEILKPTLKITKDAIKRLKEVTAIGLPSALGNALNPLSISIGNYFLAQGHTEKVAGLGIGTKLMIFSMIPAMALSAGLGPMIGQNFGSSNTERLMRAMRASFTFSVALGVIQVLILAVFPRFLSQLFSENQIAIDYSADFLRISSLTLFGYSFVIMTSSMFNAIGRPLRAFWIIALRTLFFFLGTYYPLIWLGISQPVIWAYTLANLLAGMVSLKQVFKNHLALTP